MASSDWASFPYEGESDHEPDQDYAGGEGHSWSFVSSRRASRRGSAKSAGSDGRGKLPRLNRDQRGWLDRELAVLSGPTAPILEKAAEWAHRIEEVRSKTASIQGPLSGRLKVAGCLFQEAVRSLANRGATTESELALLREKNELLRLELLKQKEEREKLRNYVRAHSPYFGAPISGLASGGKPPPTGGSPASVDTVIIEEEGGSAAPLHLLRGLHLSFRQWSPQLSSRSSSGWILWCPPWPG